MSKSVRRRGSIRFCRCLRLALHLAWIALGTAALYPLVGASAARPKLKRWSRQILNILAVRAGALQPTDAPPGSLIVANHVSWLDIFAIHALRPAAFVSKAEIRQWPFIGWLAAQNDTVFLRRGSRGHARMVNTRDRRAAQRAAWTSPSFRKERPPTERTCSVFTPLCCNRRSRPGARFCRWRSPTTMRRESISLAPSFAGETTLMQCFSAILACRSLTVRLNPAPAIDTVGRDPPRVVAGGARARRHSLPGSDFFLRAIHLKNRPILKPDSRQRTAPQTAGIDRQQIRQ